MSPTRAAGEDASLRLGSTASYRATPKHRYQSTREFIKDQKDSLLDPGETASLNRHEIAYLQRREFRTCIGLHAWVGNSYAGTICKRMTNLDKLVAFMESLESFISVFGLVLGLRRYLR
jgi:hypothetical protein